MAHTSVIEGAYFLTLQMTKAQLHDRPYSRLVYLFFREFKLIKGKEFVYHASVFVPVAFFFLQEGCSHREMLFF